jgi:outer membrane protein assembly factor BamB
LLVAMRKITSWLLPLAGVVALAGGVLAPAAAGPRVTPDLDWPQFLHDPQHSSVSPATAFTPANSGSVTLVWRWKPPVITGEPAPRLDASPTVVAGRVYIGAQSGGFYALNESTGAVDWSTQLDTCTGRGITATAAVEPDPMTGVSTVYVSGAHYLYALNAATGALVWETRIGPDTGNPHDYYDWSSPTVVAGHIYVGLADGCNGPHIPGGVVELDQHTGQVLATWNAEPSGSIGASVWSTVAASPSGNNVWASTGSECDPATNHCPAGNKPGDAISIVHLSSSLKLLQAWQVPDAFGHDWDFGSSPTLFSGAGGRAEVGACNKDGNYYTLAARPLGSSPLWTDAIGEPYGQTYGSCIASSVWDARSHQLFIAGEATTIAGTSFGGSIREVNPTTGAFGWQTGLPCADMGTPSLDGAGVLAAVTWFCTSPNEPGAYLLDAANGAVLSTLPTGKSLIFSQPVFAQDTLFVATQTGGLYDFAP